MAKIWKKILEFCLIFLIVTAWIFSGWPRIWKKPPVPPEIEKVRAAEIEHNYCDDASVYSGITVTSSTNAHGTPDLNDASSSSWDKDVEYWVFNMGNTSLSSFDSARIGITFWDNGTKHADDWFDVEYKVNGNWTRLERFDTNNKLPTTRTIKWNNAPLITNPTEANNCQVRIIYDKQTGPDDVTLDVDGVEMELTYTPVNQTPIVNSISIDPTPTITLEEDSTKTVTITATITDNDDCEDVFDNGLITAWFYQQGVTCTAPEHADDNNCYPNITLDEVGNTCDTGTEDPSGDASATVPDGVWFHANPGTWVAKVTATDAASESGSNTETVTIDPLVAFKLDTNSIPYGTVYPDNVSIQQAILITTTGNAAIDVQLSGTKMDWSTNEILVGQQKYSATNDFNWETEGDSLTATPACHELSTGKPTQHDPNLETENVYWKLKVPTGKPGGGPYTGTNYFDVVSGGTCP